MRRARDADALIAMAAAFAKGGVRVRAVFAAPLLVERRGLSTKMDGESDIVSRLAARTAELHSWETELTPGMTLVDQRVRSSVHALESLRDDVPQWSSAFKAVRDIAGSTSKHFFRPHLVFLGYGAGKGWQDWSVLDDSSAESSSALPNGLVNFAAGVELQHLFMFVHDDMMDHAVTRRGQDTIQVAIKRTDRKLRLPGQDGSSSEAVQHLTTLVGDVLQAKSLQLLAAGEMQVRLDAGPSGGSVSRDGATTSNPSTSAVDIILEGAFRAGAAQFDDILGWSGVERALVNDASPPSQLLERLLEDKASFHSFAAPLIAGLRLARIDAGPDPVLEAACARWAMHIGAAYQGIDDVMDFVLEVKDSGKDRLQDIQEGRLSLPLFLLRQHATSEEWEQVFNILGSQTVLAPADRHHLLKLVDKYALHKQSLSFVTEQIDQAKAAMQDPVLSEGRPLLSRGLNVFVEAIVEVKNRLCQYTE